MDEDTPTYYSKPCNIFIDTQAQAAYVQLAEERSFGDVHKTVPYEVFIDFDKNGNVLGIEILNWTEGTPS